MYPDLNKCTPLKLVFSTWSKCQRNKATYLKCMSTQDVEGKAAATSTEELAGQSQYVQGYRRKGGSSLLRGASWAVLPCPRGTREDEGRGGGGEAPNGGGDIPRQSYR